MSAESTPQHGAAGQERLQALLVRSAADREFRQKLLTDPRAAISEATGRELPASYNVKFVENTADATVVLPDRVDPDAELADSELEAVAGGASPALFGAGMLIGGGVAQIVDKLSD